MFWQTDVMAFARMYVGQDICPDAQSSVCSAWRSVIPANIHLNVTAAGCPVGYTAKLLLVWLSSLISGCLGIISPRTASK